LGLARDTNRLRVLTALIVVAVLLDASVLVDSSVAQGRHGIAQGAQPNGVNTVLQVVAPLGNWTLASGPYPANLSTRGEIMAFILTNPGVYMREVSEDLGLPMGTVQYHTWMLAKNGEVEECRTGKYRRFFGAGKYTEAERKVISLLRQGTAGKIVTLLSEEQLLTHMKLAELLGLSSQALTWHMKRLESMGMVETGVFQGQPMRTYRLVDGVAQQVQAASHPLPKLVQVSAIR
jgi:DNA-binding transcriptional ArsR family regulator